MHAPDAATDGSVAVAVENLTKRYRIGRHEARKDTLGAAVVDVLGRPLRGLANLRKLTSFGEDEGDDVIWALDGVSFQVKAGERVGIIGRNGAGKSTLLKVLSKITTPTSGTATMRGRVSSLLEVGTGFHPELTGRENVYLNGTILGMTRKEIELKFNEIVEFSGVSRFIDTPVKRYSTGMQVRLAFAVSAHLEPDVLIVDEVLAVGDAEFQRKCIGKMTEVAAEGRTVLFVSHNMSTIRRLCETAYHLDNGKIVAHGPADEVVESYLRFSNDSDFSVDASGGLEWTFEGDADKAVDIRAVRIVNNDAVPVSTVDNRYSIVTEVEFEVRSVEQGLDVYWILYGPDGSHVCASQLTDQGRPSNLPDAPGRFKAKVTFPENLLNSGQYRLGIAIVDGMGEKAYDRKDIPLHVTNMLGFGETNGFRRMGPLLMPLDWEFGREGS